MGCRRFGVCEMGSVSRSMDDELSQLTVHDYDQRPLIVPRTCIIANDNPLFDLYMSAQKALRPMRTASCILARSLFPMKVIMLCITIR